MYALYTDNDKVMIENLTTPVVMGRKAVWFNGKTLPSKNFMHADNNPLECILYWYPNATVVE